MPEGHGPRGVRQPAGRVGADAPENLTAHLTRPGLPLEAIATIAPSAREELKEMDTLWNHRPAPERDGPWNLHAASLITASFASSDGKL